MKRLRKLFLRLSKAVAAFWLVRFTLAGKLVAGGCLLAAASTAGIDVPTQHLFVALVLLLILSLVVGLVFYPRLTVVGDFPTKATAGHTVSGQFTITNHSRFPVFDIELDVFGLPAHIGRAGEIQSIAALDPGETGKLAVTLSLDRRGLYQLPDVLAFSAFPFHLFRLGQARQPLGSLLVLPSFNPLTVLHLPAGTRYQPGGVAFSSHVGESPEYIGSREYMPGESFRRLDHRAWARLGIPAVREFHEEYYCRVGIVMDTYVPWRFRNRLKNPLEASVDLTAAVAETLSRGETLINVFASGPELYVFESGRHTAHLENVLEILACVEPCRRPPYDSLAPAIMEQLDQISATVCILLDWDEQRRTLAQAVIDSGSHLKLVFLRSGETSLRFDESEFDDVRFLNPESVLQGKVDEL